MSADRSHNDFHHSFLSLWSLPSLVAVFCAIHLFPFIYFHSRFPLGFDTGFYRRYLIEPLTSIPHASVPGLDHTVIIPRVFLDLLRLTGLSTDSVLFGGYIFAMALLLIAFWYFVREMTTRPAAYFATLLVLLSPVYYLGYWSFYLKNMLGLAFFFLLLIALRRGHIWYVILLSLALPITHQSTTIYAGIVLFLLAAYAFWKKRDWKHPLASWAVLFSTYLYFHPNVGAKVAAPPVGVFLNTLEFLIYAGPLIVIVAAGLWHIRTYLQEREWLWVPTAVPLVFMVIHFSYYQRLFFPLVFFLSAVAGYLLSLFYERGQLRYLSIIVVAFGIYGASFLLEHTPLLKSDTEQALSILIELPENASIITPSYLAPWVHGSTRANVYAPGVFKDAATPTEWQNYWEHSYLINDMLFLRSFPKPLYFFVARTDRYDFLPIQSCVEAVTDYLYRYTCENGPRVSNHMAP